MTKNPTSQTKSFSSFENWSLEIIWGLEFEIWYLKTVSIETGVIVSRSVYQ